MNIEPYVGVTAEPHVGVTAEPHVGVTAIVLHYGDASLTRRALASLRAQRLPARVRLTVLCADNGSASGVALRDEVQQRGDLYVRFERNLGFAEGCNRAVAFAVEQTASTWVLLLNNDAYAEPDALACMLQAAEETGAALVGPMILHDLPGRVPESRHEGTVGSTLETVGLSPAGLGQTGSRLPVSAPKTARANPADDVTRPPIIWAAGGELSPWRCFGRNRGAGEVDRGQYNRREKHPFLSGCTLLVRCDAFEQLQGFESAFFMYQEDVDLCFRARRLGLAMVFEPRARVFHTGSATAGDELGALQSYYRWRNRLLLVDRQAVGLARPFFWWVWFPALVVRDLLRYGARGRAACWAPLVRGLIDFFRVRKVRTAWAGLPGATYPGSPRADKPRPAASRPSRPGAAHAAPSPDNKAPRSRL